MQIRLKILMGALALTLVTVAFGFYSRSAEQRLGALSFRLYDDAFMAMSYLRAAQNSLLATDAAGTATADIEEMEQDLEVARQRAMSERGRAAAAALKAHVGQLRAEGTEPKAAKAALQAEFDTAVEVFAGDAFRYRREVGDVLQHTDAGAQIALVTSVVLALSITLALARSIVPPVRKALSIAQSIADGRLDNVILAHGNSETARLLRALAAMQQAIGSNGARVKTLMEEQARDHARTVQQQMKVDALVQSFGAAIGGVFRSVSASSDRVAATAARLTSDAAAIVSNGREAEGQLARSVDSIGSSSSATRSLSEALRTIGGEAAQSETRAQATLAETAAAATRMQQTREAAVEIEQMVDVITTIAGQTRMLALNATIEAARAGAAGKGFSVVASEVKRLAQASSAAAQSVAERVARIMEAVNATASGIGAIDISAQQVHALSASIAASVALQDTAAEELWSTIWEISVNLGQARTGVDTTLGVTAGSAQDLGEIGASAVRLAKDAAGLSLEVAEFLEVVGSLKGGEAIEMVALDQPATLRFGTDFHRGRVVAGSGVMVHFCPAFAPDLAVEPGTAGALQMKGMANWLDIRVAGHDGGILQLQPPLARSARAGLQAGFAELARAA